MAMSIPPEGENVRKAVRWISAERQDHPERPLAGLIDKACLMFNLSPLEADTLARTLRSGKAAGVPESVV
jgi:hypothetical protein